jgi:hypothetical protein
MKAAPQSCFGVRRNSRRPGPFTLALSGLLRAADLASTRKAVQLDS